MTTDAPIATTDERKAALTRELDARVRSGERVESQSETQAVTLKGHRTNHILHLILSLVTLGAWLLVWLLMVVFGGEKRTLVTVDEAGVVAVKRV